MKDYKSRIQEYEFDWRPEAWLSMEHLIQESLPAVTAKSGISWWKQIFGKGLTTVGIGIIMLSMEGQKFGSTAEVQIITKVPEETAVPIKEHTAVLQRSKQRKVFDRPVKEMGASSQKNPTTEKYIQALDSSPETTEVTMVHKAKSVAIEQQSTSSSPRQASSLPDIENEPLATQKVDHPFAAHKKHSRALPALVRSSRSMPVSNTTMPMFIAATLAEQELIEPPLPKSKRAVQFGSGLSASKNVDGWHLGTEVLFPINKRLDWGTGLTYTQLNLTGLSPDIFGQSFGKRFSFAEGDIRLFWKFFTASRHQARIGAAAGLQYANTYEVSIFHSPNNIEITKETKAQWRLSTHLFADYRYRLTSSYFLGLQTGIQASPQQNFFLKLSAGFSW